jgi:hypothetical protein
MYEDPSDEPLEALLREHFSRELDPQVGRAGAAFSAQVLRQADQGKSAAHRLGLWATVAAALAASIVVAAVLNRPPDPVATPQPEAKREQSPAQSVSPQPAALAESPDSSADPTPSVEESPAQPADAVADGSVRGRGKPNQSAEGQILIKQGVDWRVLDSEVIDVDSGTPVRKLRRQRLEKREYLDQEHGARMKLFLPREEVRYESIPTN